MGVVTIKINEQLQTLCSKNGGFLGFQGKWISLKLIPSTKNKIAFTAFADASTLGLWRQ